MAILLPPTESKQIATTRSALDPERPTHIKQLRARGLILEVAHEEDVRRRYYKLSGAGAQALEEQLEYYQNVVSLARKRKLLNGTPHGHIAWVTHIRSLTKGYS